MGSRRLVEKFIFNNGTFLAAWDFRNEAASDIRGYQATNQHLIWAAVPACVSGCIMTAEVFCGIRERLSIQYNLRLLSRAQADEELRKCAETASASEYQHLSIIACESRLESEVARLELEKHIRQHGCGNHAN